MRRKGARRICFRRLPPGPRRLRLVRKHRERAHRFACSILVESGPNGTGGQVNAGAGRRYAISVRCRRGHSVSAREWSELEHRVRQVILPALAARSLTPTDPID